MAVADGLQTAASSPLAATVGRVKTGLERPVLPPQPGGDAQPTFALGGRREVREYLVTVRKPC